MSITSAAGRAGAAGATLAVLGLAILAVPSAAAEPAPPVAVPATGADLVSITMDGPDNLALRLRDAGQRARGAAGHEPAAVQLPGDPVTEGTAGTVPDHPAYGFLGAPGQPVWALAPADPAGGAGFPAWDATGVPADRIAGEAVELSLVDVAGPGAFHAYTLSPVGAPRLLLGTSAGAPERTSVAAGAREPGVVWAFDAPGSYEITLAAGAELAGGGTATGEATYRVEVPEFSVAATTEAGPLAGAGPVSAQNWQAQQLPRQGAPTGEGRVVIGDGHVDIGPRFVDGDWTIQVKDDTVSPLVWRNLSDVVLQVVDQAQIEVPEGGGFDFLGEPGDTVWLLPQAQQPGILWPGWNTEDASVVERVSGDTTWRLHEVSGPGAFVLFLTGSFGQSQILFNSQESLPQSMPIPLRTHAHGNFGFTAPGVYHLTIEMSATTTDGEQASDTRVLAFAVGDATDPNDAFPPAGGGNGGNGNGDGNGGGGGRMPLTGFTGLLAIAGTGAALLAAGVVLVLLTRRRRAARSASS